MEQTRTPNVHSRSQTRDERIRKQVTRGRTVVMNDAMVLKAYGASCVAFAKCGAQTFLLLKRRSSEKYYVRRVVGRHWTNPLLEKPARLRSGEPLSALQDFEALVRNTGAGINKICVAKRITTLTP